jgi:hypothetical protein
MVFEVSMMKNSIIKFGAAVIALMAAWACWREARLVTQLADAKTELVTLQLRLDDELQPRATLSDYLPVADRALASDVTEHRATVEYWLSRYADVMDLGRGEVDANLLLLAANSAYRTSQRDGFTGTLAVQQLDGVLQAYATVLKAAPDNVDAAYNFELVARVRDQAAMAAEQAAKGKAAAGAADHSQHPSTRVPPPSEAARSLRAGGGVALRQRDLPLGPTIHGTPGGPPPDVKAEEFEIIAPMDFGDREAQPEPTPGGKLPRKG